LIFQRNFRPHQSSPFLFFGPFLLPSFVVVVAFLLSYFPAGYQPYWLELSVLYCPTIRDGKKKKRVVLTLSSTAPLGSQSV
jgi:ABC-type Fe3+ transport system permease subunit